MLLSTRSKISRAARGWKSASCLLPLAAIVFVCLNHVPGAVLFAPRASREALLQAAGAAPPFASTPLTQQQQQVQQTKQLRPNSPDLHRPPTPPFPVTPDEKAPASEQRRYFFVTLPDPASPAAAQAESTPNHPTAPVGPSGVVPRVEAHGPSLDSPAIPPTTLGQAALEAHPPWQPAAPPPPPPLSDLLTAPTPASGFVPKSGPTSLHFWIPANDSARVAEFDAWEAATAREPNATLAASWRAGVRLPHLPPLYLNCMIYVNHRYKFIYVRHPKSASSSIIHHFKPCGEPGVPGAADKAGRGVRETAEQLQNLGLGAACLQPHRVFAAGLSPAEARSMWSDYFVFSAVRNPYARFLSAYKFLLHKMRGDPGCPAVRWDDFCADPVSLGRACKQHPHCCPLDPWFYFHHVVDQGRCVTTEGDGWAVDYLVAVEKLEEQRVLDQMAEVVAEIDRRRDPGLPPLANVTFPMGVMNQGEGEGCSAGTGRLDAASLQPEQDQVFGVAYNASVLLDRHCSLAEYYQGEHAHCLDQARHFYHTDFRRLYGQDHVV